ncbi:uncharacterized protein LOC127863172 isoform X2 [Dreissena polymorpha]|uniref:Methyltransferase FkbM domain-containing protein n=2 Tax=Dreissena polymorpha TaxID=45954 RepID=A0A9D3Y5Z8_DREPO|nr:uncharacterized protein LOC127863172 isoform X2 [Dreissena polymorpha]XP_052258527.1 uncharacterized protein LOC127863172 isoform X2 [Dreissena polymorpha]XP_052258528.1 uncharacterized protein LOC127863172 isoform X2 [Dreissena polymorpha]KAH3693206.1 hypothetical protein DPMN_192608 [Dreissena polymorpha]
MAQRQRMSVIFIALGCICVGLVVGFMMGSNSVQSFFLRSGYIKGDLSVPDQQLASSKYSAASVITNVPVIVNSQTRLVRVFNSEQESEQLKSFANQATCTPLRVSSTITPQICVYDGKTDHFISASILSSGTWEGEHMSMLHRILGANKGMELFDIGSNIGVFTVLAAKVGHRVVAVDPLKKNLMLLSRSLRTGGLTENTTLLWNAVGDKVVNITLHEYVGNVGGTYVKPDDGKANVDELHRALAVTLDHLIPFSSKRPIFMKMDIETYEWNALKSGEEFFNQMDVRYVLLEWNAHRKNVESQNNIISFMSRHNMLPHRSDNPDSRLQYTENASWPGDIFWIKKM